MARSRRGIGLLLFPVVVLSLVVVAVYCFLPLADQHLPTPTTRIWGQVLDGDEPVANVSVCARPAGLRERTRADGSFEIYVRRSATVERVTVAADGYFIAGAPTDSLPAVLQLKRLPKHDADDYDWVDPASQRGGLHNCAHCHGEIYREWTASAHSRSANGKHFRNLYDGTDWHGKPEKTWSLLDQRPDGIAVCASCHAPAIPAGDPALFDLRDVKGVAAKGVHCDYCHKISGVGDGKLGLTHGRFNLNLLRPAKAKDGEEQHQIFFGPLDDVDRGDDVYAPIYKKSLYCASCHEGVVFGVPVYTTYSEWLASPAKKIGKECQDCHMKPTGDMKNFAPGAGGRDRDPQTLGNHRFLDGNLDDMLRRSVRAKLSFETKGDEVHAQVQVGAFGVGHRVPTGFIDRHLVLVVEGSTAQGDARPVKEGPRLPAIAGVPFAGKGGKLYAKLLKDDTGRSPAPFWAAETTPTDNRLSPDQWDETTFIFPADVERVRVRILYRRFWPETTQRKQWPDRDLVVVDEMHAR